MITITINDNSYIALRSTNDKDALVSITWKERADQSSEWKEIQKMTVPKRMAYDLAKRLEAI